MSPVAAATRYLSQAISPQASFHRLVRLLSRRCTCSERPPIGLLEVTNGLGDLRRQSSDVVVETVRRNRPEHRVSPWYVSTTSGIRMAFLGGLRRRIEDSHRQIIPHQGPAWCKRTKPAAKQRVNLPLSRRFHRDKVGDVLMCLPRYGCAGQASIAPALVMVMIMIFVNCW